MFVNYSGVHHKKKNCESNQVISKVQQVLRIATKSHQLYPKSLTLTVASVVKKSKLRKGNGGWSDVRDHNLCLNVTWASYWSNFFASRCEFQWFELKWFELCLHYFKVSKNQHSEGTPGKGIIELEILDLLPVFVIRHFEFRG